MLLPYPNPVISAMTLEDDAVLGVYQQCRKIHRDIQAGEGDYHEAKNWEPYIVYLMLIGDCMSRELTRRGLGELHQVNLILQHPQNMYPAYWKNIIVPSWLHEIVFDMSETETKWGPDVYPEELPDVADELVAGDPAADAVEQEQVDAEQ